MNLYNTFTSHILPFCRFCAGNEKISSSRPRRFYSSFNGFTRVSVSRETPKPWKGPPLFCQGNKFALQGDGLAVNFVYYNISQPNFTISHALFTRNNSPLYRRYKNLYKYVGVMIC